jgi:hypothetical protein
MTHILEVIPARRWVHVSGRTASLYGAVPYLSDAEKADWRIDTVGFTWRCADGTIGLGRPAAETQEEAEAVMARVNAL